MYVNHLREIHVLYRIFLNDPFLRDLLNNFYIYVQLYGSSPFEIIILQYTIKTAASLPSYSFFN